MNPPGLVIVHDMVCRHRIEVQVTPARAQLYFKDERFTNPIDTQIRFEAILYNSDGGVRWEVLSPTGGPGFGTIDDTGLYRAPDKGGLESGSTEIIAVTSRADPLRKAFAWVTLVGLGPLPAPAPKVVIWPKEVTLYYISGAANEYIDVTNKLQLFRAFPENIADQRIEWLVNGANAGGPDPWFTYFVPNLGGGEEITVTAALQAQPSVTDDAKIRIVNYNWPNF
jgi:hypothetical protein